MTTEHQEVPPQNTKKRRGPKTFPVLPFEEVVRLAMTIHDAGLSGQMRRVTLLGKLERSPESSQSRTLITVSSRYGLTEGSYQAQQISITDVGGAIAADAPSFTDTRNLIFEQAIEKFAPFNHLYEKLTDKRVPDDDVLVDELTQLGVDAADCQQAAAIFMSNARYVGLVREIGGAERFIPIDQVLEETASRSEGAPMAAGIPSPSQEAMPAAPPPQQVAPHGPSLHIDVQVHIDSSATPEQIEQIFASMAKHLYGRDG